MQFVDKFWRLLIAVGAIFVYAATIFPPPPLPPLSATALATACVVVLGIMLPFLVRAESEADKGARWSAVLAVASAAFAMYAARSWFSNWGKDDWTAPAILSTVAVLLCLAAASHFVAYKARGIAYPEHKIRRDEVLNFAWEFLFPTAMFLGVLLVLAERPISALLAVVVLAGLQYFWVPWRHPLAAASSG